MLTHRFDNENGPIWAVRVCQESPESDSLFHYRLTFTTAHSQSDGSSSIRVMNAFHDILDDVVLGRKVRQMTSIGFLSDRQKTESLLQIEIEKLKKDKDYDNKIGNFVAKLNSLDTLKLYKEHQAPKEGTIPETGLIERILDEDTTSRLLQRCRQEKTTVNSAYSAAMDLVFLNQIREKYGGRDKVLLPHGHLINVRRYWEDHDPSEVFPMGCHVMRLFRYSEIDESDVEDFWTYVRQYQKVLSEEVKDELVIKSTAYEILHNIKDHVFESDNVNDVYKCYYIVSNMGNIDNLFSGKGDAIQTSYLTRLVELRHFYNTYFVHTFKGKFYSMYAYGKEYIRDDAAQKNSDQLFDILLKNI